MRIKIPIRKPIIVLLCVFLSMGVLYPKVDAVSTKDGLDGIWYDSFNDTKNITFLDHSPSNLTCVNGAIEFKKNTTEYKTYSFDDSKIKHQHFAYFYTTSFFIIPWWRKYSPQTHISKENMFDDFFNQSIKFDDTDYATQKNFILKNCIIQHFRFKLDSSADIINEINITWKGKATKNANMEFLYWNKSGGILKRGIWNHTHLGYDIGKDNITKHLTLKKGEIENALDDNNYIDFCVIAYFFPNLLKSCSLSTNYVQVKTKGEQGYKIGTGIVQTKDPIDPTAISTRYKGFYWETLTWNDYKNDGTTIHYQLLYEDSTPNNYIPVENKFFLHNPGENNTYGFTQPPVYLNAIPYEKLKIRAVMKNDVSPLTTPRIYSWALTWQNSTQWQDSFNTSYRVARKNKVVVGDGFVDISRIQGEWPMFGFNPENNRATTGSGPTSSVRYWISNNVGGRFRNPVIGDGKIFVISDNSTVLYEYSMKKTSTSNYQPYQSSHSFENNIVNSPAITDEYVIVATGQMGNGGHINSIFALDKDNISNEPIWEFKNSNVPICYFSSPVIAGDTIYITTWGGSNGSKTNINNKLLAIDLNGSLVWPADLPAGSNSTPAVSLSSNKIIAACSSFEDEDSSLFAFDLNGKLLWNASVGTIGYASPVIYKDMVFVMAAVKNGLKKDTKIYGLNLSDGTIRWSEIITSKSTGNHMDISDSTPAIYNDTLYVAAPNGTLFAFHAADGTPLWSISVYDRPALPLSKCQSLISSPVYAEGFIYLGTPSETSDQIKAVDTKTQKVSWSYTTAYQPDGGLRCPVLGSPIVSNGLLFVADEFSHLYCMGIYSVPTQQRDASLTSLPIRLPESYWWDKFFAYTNYNTTYSQITFKLLDENFNIIKDLQNGSSLLLSTRTLPRTIRLRADFTTKNVSADNPQLLQWRLTFIEDVKPPFIDIKTIQPSFSEWLNIVVPQISIDAKDNDTGLLVSSAQYTVQYVANNNTYTNTYRAYCTGSNGTTALQTISANLSEIPDYDNITALKSIEFTIQDLAGNIARKYIPIKQDTVDPVSYVLTQSMKPRYNETAKYIWINTTSYDNGSDASGVTLVELFYRYSSSRVFSGEWILFSSSTQKSPRFSFNFTNDPGQPGGYFELCTRATDKAGNIEELPSKGDVSFLYDWTKPDYPSYSGEILWFNELPVFSVSFSDDFRLDTIQYQPNFESTWSTIASRVNASTYDTDAVGHTWVLKQAYWDRMIEGEVYYLYFRINDTLGNTLFVTNNNDAIVIRKDTSPPSIDIDTPDVDTQLTWNDNFKIEGLGSDKNGSGIKEAFLYYRFSKDNSTWGDWSVFGDTPGSLPYEWQFSASDGDGYYQIKINVTDYAGNVVGSPTRTIIVASFPTTLALILVGLIVVFLIISIVLFFKWRKKQTT
ncbi:MAG: PQQ-binding-like beta-propeller repeat protein [Candidatus Thermoplasmatota archaeon]|nr:PQQ-binding-like beta-propeller repeat protein [Candidatus Thermoplasmatota archaeon]